MWIAFMETEHYSWRAYGETEAQAKNALLKEWRKDKDRSPRTIAGLEEWYGIRTEECIPGRCNWE